jgi:hypothetical protein
MMKTVKIPALLAAMAIAAAFSLPAFAQSEVTREHAQAVLGRVSQDVWHAQLSSTGYGRVQELYTEGERAYFKGDYATAVKKLNQADKIVRGMPNDYGADLESERPAGGMSHGTMAP